MSNPSDLRPLFYVARFLGNGPHAISENDILVTKRGLVYSGFCAVVFLAAFMQGIYLISIDEQLEPRLLLLTIIRTVLFYICLFTDMGLTLLWNRKLRLVLAHLRKFDEATKNSSKVGKQVFVKCTLIIVVIFLFWTTVGLVTFFCEFETPLFDAVTYAVINATVSFQLMKFAGLVYLICERFQRLGDMLLEPDGYKITVMDRSGKQFRLQEVWWLHNTLATAMETINSVYGTQLLFWIAAMSFNTLTRIYTINENPNVAVILKTREALLVSACVANLLIIAIICHVTAAKANNIAKVAFSPLSLVTGRRSFTEDNLEAATYFQLKQMHFFAGAGLIRIDIPLLLSIASGITTYLVILHAANAS